MLRMKRRGIAVGTCILLAGGGCAKPQPAPAVTQASAAPLPSRASPPAPSAAFAPHWANAGTVVGKKSSLPLAGVSVSIGGANAVTGADGRFEVPAGSERFDVILASADRSLISVYLGIARRDPRLVQLEPDDPQSGDSQPTPRAHQAELRGKLTGASGEPLADGSIQVGFFSERGRAQDVVRLPSAAPSAEFGPLLVSWDGPSVLSGQFYALQMVHGGTTLVATVAHGAVTLADHAKVKLDLPMTPVPIEHRPADRVSELPELFSVSVGHTYHVIGGGTFHGVGPIRAGADYDSPDLRALGATLCVDASVWNPYRRSAISRCDPPANAPVALTLHEPPVILEPKRGTLALPGMTFQWSPMREAVYSLELVPERGQSAAAPRIVVYTSRPSAVWPDLRALDVRFPEPLNTYRVTVSASGPYQTLDDALAPRGEATTLRSIAWKATSSDLDLPVRPPLGAEEARCNYLKQSSSDGTILCSRGIPGSVEPSAEWYALTAINNVIRNYPEFAAATGIHCVKDCAGARAFTKALAKYSEAHPGFNADEPLGPSPPEPPLPPSLRR